MTTVDFHKSKNDASSQADPASNKGKPKIFFNLQDKIFPDLPTFMGKFLIREKKCIGLEYKPLSKIKKNVQGVNKSWGPDQAQAENKDKA